MTATCQKLSPLNYTKTELSMTAKMSTGTRNKTPDILNGGQPVT